MRHNSIHIELLCVCHFTYMPIYLLLARIYRQLAGWLVGSKKASTFIYISVRMKASVKITRDNKLLQQHSMIILLAVVEHVFVRKFSFSQNQTMKIFLLNCSIKIVPQLYITSHYIITYILRQIPAIELVCVCVCV